MRTMEGGSCRRVSGTNRNSLIKQYKTSDRYHWRVARVSRYCKHADRPARHHMESMMDKETTDKVSLQGHLPYARRRISAVIPPATASPFFSSTARCHWRLVTVKAPWTAAEKWRGSKLLFEDDFDGTDSTDGDSISLDALEGEQATIAEPNELDIWIEGEALQTLKGGPQAAIGMGLRGRWGLMGTCEATWWAFKAKDCMYILSSHADPQTSYLLSGTLQRRN